jgi:hypothetical protein
MSILNNQRVIAIEEHYYDADVVAHFPRTRAKSCTVMQSGFYACDGVYPECLSPMTKAGQ